jgi:sugar phosphate isomerase/epimerase
MQIGFHTDAFNSAYWSFERCLIWAKLNNVAFIECGLIDGVSWIHGLGYQPHVALYEDPVLLRRKMEKYGVAFSQVDAAYPLSGEDGPLRGVPYVMKSIAWAAQAGCPCVDTTDGLHRPEGLSDQESLVTMKRCYEQILRVAEAHKIIVNVEPHGYFTTNPEFMAHIQAFSSSPFLRMNMDTGNTFIAGRDPVDFSQTLPAQGQPRPYQGCFGIPGQSGSRRADGHRSQPLCARRRRQCGQHPPMSEAPL